MNLTPNVKKLIIAKMSKDAIPNGGGLKSAINYLSNSNLMVKSLREATEWVKQAINAVRLAKDPNPWRIASDEDIAIEILNKLDSDYKSRIRS